MRVFRCPLLALIGWLLSALGAHHAHAAEHCVATAAQLIDTFHLYQSSPDGSKLVIKLTQGTYAVGNQLGVQSSANSDRVGFELLGGYNPGCASRVLNPENTIIDAGDRTDSEMAVVGDGNADLLIEGISFRGFRSAPNDSAISLSLDIGTSDTARFTIRHCRFIQNQAHIAVHMRGAQLYFINNLVANNALDPGLGATAVQMVDAYDADTGVIVNNNTIANNTGGGGLSVNFFQPKSDRLTEIASNIIWGNGGIDLDLNDLFIRAPISVSHNLYGDYFGLQALSADNISGNPLFIQPLSNNFNVSVASPAINSGATFQSGGFPTKDLSGDARLIGSRIDRGAEESSVNDLTGFIVTTAADNGNNTSPLAGSLRAAVKAANAASGPFRISFQIGGSCPRTLNIAGTMLDITGDVTIDGTSIAGWAENTSFGRFDATLCLFINGTGSTPWAFRVPSNASNARLTVRGLMFAGFSDAAIKLEGGDNHMISGNQFGAIGFTVPNNNAIRITGNSGNALIGGFDHPGSINLIAGSSAAGIQLDNAAGGSVLANNVIGFQTDGTSAGSNATGVYIFDSPSNILMYNYIGNSSSNGVTLSGAGSTGTLIQSNFIGTGLARSAAPNGGAGVLAMFGARNSVIGAPLSGSYGANEINYNVNQGVWVSQSGGTGNRVLSNYIYANTGLAIDLGASGPTANQTNPGTGPNASQNYPVLESAVRSAPATTTLTGTLTSTPNTAFRIDAYVASCRRDGRADPQGPLGQFQITTNAQGIATFSSPVSAVPDLLAMGLTATDPAGNTSEIGNCIVEQTADAPLFRYGFESGCSPNC